MRPLLSVMALVLALITAPGNAPTVVAGTAGADLALFRSIRGSEKEAVEAALKRGERQHAQRRR